MVVLAASIVTRSGKAVLSRQFREMPKTRVEALLAALPTLLSSAGAQHTTVETDHVRYVYQPLEELNMVLITNRQSNILQDISTLHLFAQIVQGQCRQCNEAEILKHAFEIIEAFDEVCAFGLRENLTLPQVRNFLEMDSHEERIQEIIEKNKELEANEERKRRAKQIEQQRKEMQRRGMESGIGGGGAGGAGGFRNGVGAGGYNALPRPGGFQAPVSAPTTQAFSSKLTKAAPPRGKGLALGKKSKQSNLFEAVRGEAESVPLMVAPEEPLASSSSSAPSGAAAAAARPDDMESIHIKVNEVVEARANRDGGLESVEIKGDLSLLITDRERGKVKVVCGLDNAHNIQLKTHPNVDKAAWSSQQTIGLRDPSKSFPIDTTIGVLRWRHALSAASANDANVPVQLTCWPSPTDAGGCELTIEFEHAGTEALTEVVIVVPLVNDTDPQIGEASIDGSDVTVSLDSDNANGAELRWTIPIVEAGTSGSLELALTKTEADELFPITCTFATTNPIAGVEVADVKTAADGDIVPFSKETSFQTVLTVQ